MDTIITIDSTNNGNWQNATDTGKLEWSGGSWKDYWIKYSGKEWPKYCCKEGCYQEAEHGAHVTRSNSKTVYIIPLCVEHNPRSNKPAKLNPCFNIKVGSVLVNADDAHVDKVSRG